MRKKIVFIFFITFALLFAPTLQGACENTCYSQKQDNNCASNKGTRESYTLHMSVHPHLDAYWIFNMDSYFDPKPTQIQVLQYFNSNRFNSVKQIFDTATKILIQSKQHREKYGKGSQKGHRSFFNSEMGFFKKWYMMQNTDTKSQVKKLLKTKYWEIVGGGFVQNDQGCAYYDDIIENYQTGLNFLKQQFNYFPKASISADSFGHSQTNLAILAHLGIQGFFVERSDQHILLQNKTQFIWKAKSANGQYYGALPTHIRWAIHGFEDQFIKSSPSQNLCFSKDEYLSNIRSENQFLKNILQSPHIMRYFGHDFQKFDDYSYDVIETIMRKFSSQKCNKVVAVYGNPTQYFLILMGQVFGKKEKLIASRQEDIFPIWDYDSGLYWTGYFTTDPYHKKNYRDAGRFLYAVRKLFTPFYFLNNERKQLREFYQILEQLGEQVSYLQHHDGISGTSKYLIMDQLEVQNENLTRKVKQTILQKLFQEQFDTVIDQKNQYCFFGSDCKITNDQNLEINLRIFNSAGFKRGNQPFIITLPYDSFYTPDCPYEINCLCQQLPCQCSLYLYPKIYGTFVNIKLTKHQFFSQPNKFQQFPQLNNDKMFSFNKSHFKIELNNKKYSIGYKKIDAVESSTRKYSHLNRYGKQAQRSFMIRSGKYALGNIPATAADISTINKVMRLESERNIIFLIKWKREGMKTLISINKAQQNEWKVQTHSAATAYHMEDLYLEIQTQIDNKNKFFTDSNGWLVMKRQLFHHSDYKAYFDPSKHDDVNGNSYPITAFAYIEGKDDKVSINTDRPQGVIVYKPGTLWVNFDRLSLDDGKWVYENTFRSDYQKFTHVVTVQNQNNNERKIQTLYDMPIITQISYSKNVTSATPEPNSKLLQQWRQFSGLNDLKTLIKPINDSTLLVRVHNLNDKQNKTVRLFVGNVSPLLTAFYGSKVKIDICQQRSLGNNMGYKQFLSKKWNWQQVVNLQKENQIFNKQLGQTMILRPLQIRTFLFYGVKFTQSCESPSHLRRSKKRIRYTLNTKKPAPKRQFPYWEEDAIQYLLEADHCKLQSPILKEKVYPEAKQQKLDTTYQNQQIIFVQDEQISKKPNNAGYQNQNQNQNEQSQEKRKNTESIIQETQRKIRQIQIREKVLYRQLLTRDQKQTYFEMRVKAIQKNLKEQRKKK